MSKIRKYIILNFIHALIIALIIFLSVENEIKVYNDSIKYQYKVIEDALTESIKLYQIYTETIANALYYIGLNDIETIKEYLNKIKTPFNEDKVINVNSFVIIDSSGKSIASSKMLWGHFSSKDFRGTQCYTNTLENPDEFHIGKLSIGLYSNKQLIPLSKGIKNKKGNYAGAVCTGLIIDDLNTSLKDETYEKYIKSVNVDLNKKNQPENSNLIKSTNYFKSYINNNPLILDHRVNFVPYKIEIIVNIEQLTKDIFLRFFVGYAYFFIIAAFLFIIKNKFINPLKNLVYTISAEKNVNNANYNLVSLKQENFLLSYVLKNNYRKYFDQLKNFIHEINQRNIKENKLKEKLYEERKNVKLLWLNKFLNEGNLVDLISNNDAVLINKTLGLMPEQEKTKFLLNIYIEQTLHFLSNQYDININVITLMEPSQYVYLNKLALNQTIRCIFDFAVSYSNTNLNNDFKFEYYQPEITINPIFKIHIPILSNRFDILNKLSLIQENEVFNLLYTINLLSDMIYYKIKAYCNENYLVLMLMPYELIKLETNDLNYEKLNTKDFNHYKIISEKSNLLGKMLLIENNKVSDSDLISYLLAFVNKRNNVLNACIMKQYKSLSNIIYCDFEKLNFKFNLNKNFAYLLKLIQEISIRLAQQELLVSSKKISLERIIKYFRTSMGHLKNEQVRAIFLSENKTIISEEIIASGNYNSISVCPTEFIKRAIHNKAASLIIAHNHPNGNHLPSKEDLSFTKTISQALNPIGIDLYDHIIITKFGYYSFYKNGKL